MKVVEGAPDPFSVLTTMRREEPQAFDSLADALLESSSKTAGLWRYLALHFIRAERYDLAAIASDKHLALSPKSQEAFLRRYRIALLAADPQTGRRMLDEHRGRLSDFQYACSRYQYLQRFSGGLVPFDRELDRLRELACLEFNQALLKELRMEARQPASLPNVQSPVMPGGWDSIENTKRFARLMGKLDGVHKVTLLGNGGSLRGSKLGPYIDDQEFVIRLNYPKIAQLPEDLGTQTNLVFFTEAFLHSPDNLKSLRLLLSAYPDVPGIAIDAIRKDRVEELQVRDDFNQEVALLPVEIRVIIRALSYDFATTGLCSLVLLAILFRKEVEIYGFDFYSPNSDMHFYSKAPSEVFIGHETAFEKFLANLVHRRTGSGYGGECASA